MIRASVALSPKTSTKAPLQEPCPGSKEARAHARQLARRRWGRRFVGGVARSGGAISRELENDCGTCPGGTRAWRTLFSCLTLWFLLVAPPSATKSLLNTPGMPVPKYWKLGSASTKVLEHTESLQHRRYQSCNKDVTNALHVNEITGIRQAADAELAENGRSSPPHVRTSTWPA